MAQGALVSANRSGQCSVSRPSERVYSGAQRANRYAGHGGPLSQRVIAAIVRINAIFQSRRGGGYFGRPSSLNSMSVLRTSQTFLAGDDVRAFLLAVYDDARHAALVVGLLGQRLPSNISRLIAEIVVDSSYRMGWTRATTNVGNEGHDIVAPLIAHGNASPAVVRERMTIGVVATLLHLGPRGILRCAGQAVAMIASKHAIGASAATTRALASPKIAVKNRSLGPAIAAAVPVSRALVVSPQHGPSAEFLPVQVLNHSGILRPELSNVYAFSGGAL